MAEKMFIDALKKAFKEDPADKKTSFLWIGFVFFAPGKSSLITLGLSKVDIMIKNNIRKNIMSFIADVKTSAPACFFFRNSIFIFFKWRYPSESR